MISALSTACNAPGARAGGGLQILNRITILKLYYRYARDYSGGSLSALAYLLWNNARRFALQWAAF
ncbi:hypothetical protein GCM10025791_03220 [Halioxenophilus aromaticivorans]|uniref:Uncharacterized protein n=1 Tax=Halioxenophilus aromaticivorans TaxID=1306992 RepID=A0AAV3TXV1_9ALTE